MTNTIATYVEIRLNQAGCARAFIEGTRVRVQDVAMLAERQGRTPDQIVDAYPHLTLAQIHAALSYYFDHRLEIQSDLKADEELVEKLKSVRGPGVIDRRSKSTNGRQDDVVSS